MILRWFRRMAVLAWLAWLGIAPLRAQANVSGWVYSRGDDYGYAADEGSWLYFYSADIMWLYNFGTGTWVEDVGVGWSWFQWPYVYSLPLGTWLFASEPAGGLWAYHFLTGNWTAF